MVNASSAPATQLTRMPSVITAKKASVRPNVIASGGVMRPRGIGRLAVRVILASMSPSSAMFSAPEAPAPTAMQSSEVKASTGWKWPGAITSPTSAVKITSDITRGFNSAT
jgi:hypothetical protein